MTWDEARSQFPVFERVAYLNAGSMGPLARATVAAIAAQQRDELESGRGGPPFYEGLMQVRQTARARLAGLLGVEPARVALTSSTTDGCNIVLSGLGLGPADEIVTTDVEHFGLIGPLHASRARVRVAEIFHHPADEALERILAAVTPRTRLLALSHVAWTTGNALPILELKRETGLPILVDGAQAAGATEVEASPFDFYTVSAQKWPCGPDGTGALFVAEPDGLRVSLPSYFSQAGYSADGSFEPRVGADRFDSGWIPPAALTGLMVALDGAPPGQFERAREMTARCRGELTDRFELVTAPDQATLVSFRADGDPAALAAQAFERGVVIRDLPGTRLLRASCGYWTSDDDIERLVAALV